MVFAGLAGARLEKIPEIGYPAGVMLYPSNAARCMRNPK
jgi:hypothetical protein